MLRRGRGIATEHGRGAPRSLRRQCRIAALVLVFVVGGASGCHRGVAVKETGPVNAADGGAASAFCQAARAFVDRLGSVVNPGVPADPTEAAGLYRELAAFLATAARVGPPRIQSDAATAAGIVADYYQALESAGFSEADVPRETAARLQSPPFVEATTSVAEYSRTTCGLPS